MKSFAQTGAALAISLLVLTILMLWVLWAEMANRFSQQAAHHYARRALAWLRAEAKLSAVQTQLKQDPINIMSNANYQIIKQNQHAFLVTTRGTYRDLTVTIRAHYIQLKNGDWQRENWWSDF